MGDRINQSYADLPVTYVHGDDFPLTTTLDFDCTGCTPFMFIKSPRIDMTITFDGYAGGVSTFTSNMTPSQAAEVAALSTVDYRMGIVDAAGKRRTYIGGKMTLL